MDISAIINDLLPIAVVAIVGMLWRIDNRLQALEFGLKETDRRLTDAIIRNQGQINQMLGFLQRVSNFVYRQEPRPGDSLTKIPPIVSFCSSFKFKV